MGSCHLRTAGLPRWLRLGLSAVLTPLCPHTGIYLGVFQTHQFNLFRASLWITPATALLLSPAPRQPPTHQCRRFSTPQTLRSSPPTAFSQSTPKPHSGPTSYRDSFKVFLEYTSYPPASAFLVLLALPLLLDVSPHSFVTFSQPSSHRACIGPPLPSFEPSSGRSLRHPCGPGLCWASLHCAQPLPHWLCLAHEVHSCLVTGLCSCPSGLCPSPSR